MPVVCPSNKAFLDLAKYIKEWSESDINKNYFRDSYEAAFKMVQSEFNGQSLKWLQHNPELTYGQVAAFKGRLRQLTKNIRRGSVEANWVELMLRPGSGFAKKDPVIGKLLRDMQRSGFHFRANEMRDKTLFKSLLKSLETESKIRSERVFNGTELKLAQRKIDKLDEEYQKAYNDFANGDRLAADKIISIKSRMDNLIANSHLKVYDDMLYLLEGKSTKEGDNVVWEDGIPMLLQEKYLSLKKKDRQKIDNGEERLTLTKADLTKLKMSDGEKISDPMYEALNSYMGLMDGLYNTLRGGVRKIMMSRAAKMKWEGRDTDQINKVLEQIEDKLMPKYEQGFFPHYTRDLSADFMDGMMGKFENLQNTTNYGKKGVKDIEKILTDMSKYVSGHTIGRAEDYDYSRNFVNSVSNYIEDVNRFNFSSFMDGHVVDGLTAVERVYKSRGDARGYADSLVSFIKDIHIAANGDAEVSPATRAMMKTLLGFEFISKLGFNPRGAARNFTQRLLDYVTWGPVQISRANKYLNKMPFEGGDYEAFVDKALRESGLLFEEASPEFMQTGLDAPASPFKNRVWNDAEGRYEVNKKTNADKMADGVQWLAGKSSWMHRGAENSNRKHTFKIAFAQMHRWLSTASVRRSLEEEARETKPGKKRLKQGKSALTEGQFESRIRTQARNYAINAVVMNHFDYADYAKSRASRTKIGRFMLQFQHYSFEFFERNVSILREAKYDIATGSLLKSLGWFAGQQTGARGLEQAYRMSLFYFLAPTLVSMAFGVNVGNIVEHDTAERIKQWFTYFTSDDDDEIAAAFYGKGPLLGTVGGPLISDVIDIGVMLDLVDLDDESLLTIVAGLEEHDPSTSTEIGSKLKILNTFLARAYERHYPAFATGKPGFAFQQELALYPTAAARKRERKMKAEKKQNAERQLPMELEVALKTIELYQKEGQLV